MSFYSSSLRVPSYKLVCIEYWSSNFIILSAIWRLLGVNLFLEIDSKMSSCLYYGQRFQIIRMKLRCRLVSPSTEVGDLSCKNIWFLYQSASKSDRTCICNSVSSSELNILSTDWFTMMPMIFCLICSWSVAHWNLISFCSNRLMSAVIVENPSMKCRKYPTGP